MKNIDLLPIDEKAKKRINTLSLLYRRNAHIVMEVISFNDNRLIIRVEQKDMVNSLHLKAKELTERVRDMLKGEIPDTWKVTVSAVDFDRKDIDTISSEWLKNRMCKLGLKNRHISVHTGIDKCTLASILSGDKAMTKWHKVAFYYFFKYYELAQF
jgi:hypothetical protein